MGMDMNIMAARSIEELEDAINGDWTSWDDIKSKYDDTFCLLDRPCEVWYARKFWDMMHKMSFLTNYECGVVIRLTKNNLREMIDFYCYNCDYFGGFYSLPRLCELYQAYDSLEENGMNLYFEADW